MNQEICVVSVSRPWFLSKYTEQHFPRIWSAKIVGTAPKSTTSPDMRFRIVNEFVMLKSNVISLCRIDISYDADLGSHARSSSRDPRPIASVARKIKFINS